MNQVADRLWSLRHDPEGPLVPYLDAFAQSLDEQGFKRHLINRQIRVAAKFSQWLQAEEIAVQKVTDEYVQRFFEQFTKRRAIQRGEFACLRRLMTLLGQMGVIHSLSEHHVLTPIKQIVDAFATYLREELVLCNKTVIQYCPFVEQFLSECFGNGSVKFTALRAEDVISFIQLQALHLSPSRAKSATTALRSFLRYLHYCGEIQSELADVVPTVPNWSMTGIPRAISPNHLRAVLENCPRDTPVGRRDYAILMLLARLGFRAGEIVSLMLDSINWRDGTIAVIGKGNQVASLPLPAEVGEAIVDYLRYGRPDSNNRALFLRACAPIRELGAAQTISTIVATAIKRAGIDTPHRGSHQFRHALAKDMLRHGATLTEIGTILRHRHAKTTNLYAKIDFSALRPLSLPWPGGEK
jgi:integrase/recombinase XerD